MLYAAIIIVVVIAALQLFIATRPNTFRVARSLAVNAPADRIFPLIADFHEWAKWSPYEKMDPAMKRSYGGPASGKGASYAWDGNAQAGAGKMEILDAAAPTRVLIKLDFSKPFEGHNQAEFTIAPSGGGATVTWAMTGPVPFMMKAMHLVMSMDKLVGGQFEEGLANLKRVSES
jgi:hypothetical protein